MRAKLCKRFAQKESWERERERETRRELRIAACDRPVLPSSSIHLGITHNPRFSLTRALLPGCANSRTQLSLSPSPDSLSAQSWLRSLSKRGLNQPSSKSILELRSSQIYASLSKWANDSLRRETLTRRSSGLLNRCHGILIKSSLMACIFYQ